MTYLDLDAIREATTESSENGAGGYVQTVSANYQSTADTPNLSHPQTTRIDRQDLPSHSRKGCFRLSRTEILLREASYCSVSLLKEGANIDFRCC